MIKKPFLQLKIFLFLICTLFTVRSDGQTRTELILPDNNMVFTDGDHEGVIFGVNFKLRDRIDSIHVQETDPLKIFVSDKKAKRYVPDLKCVALIER
jgi:hypothetical protein